VLASAPGKCVGTFHAVIPAKTIVPRAANLLAVTELFEFILCLAKHAVRSALMRAARQLGEAK
jgi:hypothetical protein